MCSIYVAGITFISSSFVWQRIIFSLVICYYIGADCWVLWCKQRKAERFKVHGIEVIVYL